MVCDFFTNFAPHLKGRFPRAPALLIIYKGNRSAAPSAAYPRKHQSEIKTNAGRTTASRTHGCSHTDLSNRFNHNYE